eukprot:26450-Rhodomonas_salina.1
MTGTGLWFMLLCEVRYCDSVCCYAMRRVVLAEAMCGTDLVTELAYARTSNPTSPSTARVGSYVISLHDAPY